VSLEPIAARLDATPVAFVVMPPALTAMSVSLEPIAARLDAIQVAFVVMELRKALIAGSLVVYANVIETGSQAAVFVL